MKTEHKVITLSNFHCILLCDNHAAVRHPPCCFAQFNSYAYVKTGALVCKNTSHCQAQPQSHTLPQKNYHTQYTKAQFTFYWYNLFLILVSGCISATANLETADVSTNCYASWYYTCGQQLNKPNFAYKFPYFYCNYMQNSFRI